LSCRAQLLYCAAFPVAKSSAQYTIRVKDAHGYCALRHEPDVDLRHCGRGKDADAGIEF